MTKRKPTEDDVRAEHLAEVDQRRQWAYLWGVIAGGTILMLGLIAVLGGR